MLVTYVEGTCQPSKVGLDLAPNASISSRSHACSDRNSDDRINLMANSEMDAKRKGWNHTVLWQLCGMGLVLGANVVVHGLQVHWLANVNHLQATSSAMGCNQHWWDRYKL